MNRLTHCGWLVLAVGLLIGPALTLAAPTLAQKKELGEEPAFAAFEDRLARAFSLVINFLDPDVIVLGGGVSNVDRLYASIPRLLPAYVYSQSFETPIVRAVHGDASGVRGAAMLWPPV